MIPTPTPALTTSSNPTWQRRALTGLCWLLALSFVAGAVAKFAPGETFAGAPYSEQFADWGYPSWFRFVVGSGEIVGAALLLVPRRRFPGAALLGVILVGAVLTHVVNQDPLSEAVMAPICLALVGIVAYASRPADRHELLPARS
jgi:uncharacterized membrane protein YphA (DoxX/SURF4 family)